MSRFRNASLGGLCLLTSSVSLFAQVPVTTRSYNNARTGANLNETVLNTSNVNNTQFGKLFDRDADGEIYAQPLYVPGVNIPGVGLRNIVYVATVHDSVYAYDADDPNRTAPYWKNSYIDPANGVRVVPTSDVGGNCGTYRDMSGEIGIVGSPVIDQSTQTMYFVVRTKETVNNTNFYYQRLHAVDIRTGAEKFGSPVNITATTPGTGDGSVDGLITFDARTQNQRSALMLLNGVVYIAWASHCDTGPYHGWVMGFDAQSLNRLYARNFTPTGGYGGIWQSANGLASDGTHIYGLTGNGSNSAKDGGQDFANALLKLSPSGSSFNLVDWFMPSNTDYLNAVDEDLTAGPLLIPNSNHIVAGGKEGVLYLLDRTNLSHFNAGGDLIPQRFAVSDHHIHTSPAYWEGPNGKYVYLWGEYVNFRAYRYNGTSLTSTPVTQSTFNAPDGMPGGFISISANGSNAGSGIAWVNLPYNGDANQAVVSGVLRAFDASDLTHELWNSHQLPEDDFGNFSKFNPPVITNGKVYMASFSGKLFVYGLKPAPLAPTTVAATSGYRSLGLNWTPSAYASLHTVKRAFRSGGPYLPIAATTRTSWVDANLTNGKRYYYVVSGKNGQGEGPNSAEFTAVPGNAIPSTPTNLTSESGDGKVALRWDVPLGASTYTVRGSTSAAGPFVQLAANLTSPGFVVPSLMNGSVYYFTVSAVNPAGTSLTSPVVSAVPLAVTPGLLGFYYNDPNNGTSFNSLALTRVDPTINFDWGGGSPGGSVQSDDFSARWVGTVTPLYTQTYTFSATGDDGIRVWVNNQLLIDKWILQGATTWSGNIDLTAGVPVSVKMEYFERGGGAVAKLAWSSATQPSQIIAAAQLSIPVSVSGKLILQGGASSIYPAVFEVRPANGDPVFTRTVKLCPDGSFVLSELAAKNYGFSVSVSRFLSRGFSANLSSGSVSGVNVVLLPGDINGNRKIDVDDLTLLLNRYNSTLGDGTYDDLCDLNTDNSIDVDDLTLLLNNYNTQSRR